MNRVFKRGVNDAYEEDNRIISITNELSFVIYNTYAGNRKTLAIYRNIDGEKKEVNFILASKQQKNIGKKIALAIKELKKRPLNKLYQTYIEFFKKQFPTREIIQIITMPTQMKINKRPNETIEEILTSHMDSFNYKHEFIKYEKRVCRTCQTFGDCVKVDNIFVCEKCRKSENYKTKFNKVRDQKAESLGLIAPSKYEWCEGCGGGGHTRDRNYINHFGTDCKNPDCKFMYVCNTCKTPLTKKCEKENHDYEYARERRSITFDLIELKRVCRVCTTFTNCQTIKKKSICKNCKKIQVERLDALEGKIEKEICHSCELLILPSQNQVFFIQAKKPIHTKCYNKLGLKLHEGSYIKKNKG